MRAEVGTKLAHTFHDGREVYFDGLTHTHSERACLLCIEHGAPGADNGFGGNAADIETVSAQERLLDQGNLRSETCCACRSYQPSRPRADDDKIVAGRRGGILPIRGCTLDKSRALCASAGLTRTGAKATLIRPWGLAQTRRGRSSWPMPSLPDA